MHGYFMALKLYDAARIITNPTSYAQSRDKAVQDKISKLADSRIRTRKGPAVKVNKALAERIAKAAEREEKKKDKKKARKAAVEGDEETEAAEGGAEGAEAVQSKSKKETVLNDPRFKDLFENPAFQVDEHSREFALLNPAAVGPGAAAASVAVSLLGILLFILALLILRCS